MLIQDKEFWTKCTQYVLIIIYRVKLTYKNTINFVCTYMYIVPGFVKASECLVL